MVSPSTVTIPPPPYSANRDSMQDRVPSIGGAPPRNRFVFVLAIVVVGLLVFSAVVSVQGENLKELVKRNIKEIQSLREHVFLGTRVSGYPSLSPPSSSSHVSPLRWGLMVALCLCAIALT